jgi:hypothetical protein
MARGPGCYIRGGSCATWKVIDTFQSHILASGWPGKTGPGSWYLESWHSRFLRIRQDPLSNQSRLLETGAGPLNLVRRAKTRSLVGQN